jgi:ABC-2 type transport system ATP-binding protein
MMKIIAGFIPQSEGDVTVCGLNVLEHEMEIKKKLGYLPENNPLYYEMYVREYLEFTAGLFNIPNPKNRITEIVELVGLGKEQHKKIGELSKGYKQRVGLAQAFIHNPDVLILDEPTTGLDPNQILEIRQVIKEIGKNKTVMLSTHIMQEVEAICDRAIIISEGAIVADEDVKALKKLGKKRSKLSVEFKKRPDESVLSKLFKKEAYQFLENESCEFYAEDLSEIRKKIMSLSVESDLEIINMSEAVSNLEEVFRDLTGKKKE